MTQLAPRPGDFGALFRLEGERFCPTRAAGSPWGHFVGGGPVSALLARAIEGLIEDPAVVVARLTVDLFRPVPSEPLAVEARVLRPGKRLQMAEATLLAAGVEVARAAAQLLRTIPTDHATALDSSTAYARPGTLPDSPLLDPETQLFERAFGFHDLVGVRWVSPPTEPGPSVAWMRLPLPLVEGERPSPLVRTPAVTDYLSALTGTGSDSIASPYINTDLTLYVHRPLEGEWLGIEVDREIGPLGLGAARARLFDQTGPVGTAAMAVLVNPR